MKKIAVIFALFPLVVFAGEEQPKQKNPLSIFKKECQGSRDSAENKKNCLNEEKFKEAENNFRNFQENNHIETRDF